MPRYDAWLQVFIDFVLGRDASQGESDSEKLSNPPGLKHQMLRDATRELGGEAAIRERFVVSSDIIRWAEAPGPMLRYEPVVTMRLLRFNAGRLKFR